MKSLHAIKICKFTLFFTPVKVISRSRLFLKIFRHLVQYYIQGFHNINGFICLNLIFLRVGNIGLKGHVLIKNECIRHLKYSILRNHSSYDVFISHFRHFKNFQWKSYQITERFNFLAKPMLPYFFIRTFLQERFRQVLAKN